MAATQAVKYTPQCGDMIVESVQFQSNNFIRNFSYPQSVSAYKEICKFLINCPLAEAFTKTPPIQYQNFLREFWCTSVVEDPNPPEDDSEVLGGNYSSTEQLNSILQLLAHSLLTGTKLDIGEIIFSDLVTMFTAKTRQKYVSYPRFVSCALEVLLVTPIELTASMIKVINQESSVTSLPFSEKKKKKKTQTVTKTQPKS
ncbi:hypothetical protein Tco_0664609 [Tanacetum coccineum]